MDAMIAPSQFENHHLQIQEAGPGVSRKKSRLREGNAARMRKAGMTEQGWSLKGHALLKREEVALAAAPESL